MDGPPLMILPVNTLRNKNLVLHAFIVLLLLGNFSCQRVAEDSNERGLVTAASGVLCAEGCVEKHAAVLVFSAVDCPISNRYAPTLRKLIRGMEGKPVHFSLVYPEPEIQQLKIEEHLELFRYPCEGRPDPNFELVKLTGATVTPEAVVIDSVGKVVYRGRIDNRHKEFGKSRPKATTRDLGDAIEAVLAGKPVHEPFRPAVGCYISTE